MLKSMTGFGRAEIIDDKRRVVVEVKSVNHRYCDVNIKIPRRYSFLEDGIRKVVKEKVKRGKLDVFVAVENIAESDAAVTLNEAAAKQYYDNLIKLKDILDIKDEVSLEYIASCPDVMKLSVTVEDEEDTTKAILAPLEKALDNLNHMRITEGSRLAKDILETGDEIKGILAEIEEQAPKVKEIYREKLHKRIKELLEDGPAVHEERIALEVAIFADKSSIAEEITRLNSHMAQLSLIVNGNDKAAGKKIDFLVQEMNREANTIGSKANDLKITGMMLQIKSLVENIREQVQNVE